MVSEQQPGRSTCRYARCYIHCTSSADITVILYVLRIKRMSAVAHPRKFGGLYMHKSAALPPSHPSAAQLLEGQAPRPTWPLLPASATLLEQEATDSHQPVSNCSMEVDKHTNIQQHIAA